MVPSVLMTKRNDEALPPREEGTVFVADLPALAVQQIADLPASELARLSQEAEANLRIAQSITASLEDALDYRYGARAKQVRAADAKDTGTVRFEDNGFTVVADLPKRVKWDQQRLKKLVDLIGSSWGEDPADYVKIKFEVSERAYESWPPRLKESFTPARTVETGRPSYELIPPDGRAPISGGSSGCSSPSLAARSMSRAFPSAGRSPSRLSDR
jgi:hypothetical protein